MYIFSEYILNIFQRRFGGCGGHTSYDRKRQVSNFTITGLKAVSLGGYGETFGPGVVIEGVLNLSVCFEFKQKLVEKNANLFLF